MRRRQVVTYAVTIFLLFIIWFILSLGLGRNILPDPFLVVQQGIKEIGTYPFWVHVEVSVLRMVIGLSLAFILAVPAGLILGSNPKLDNLFAPLIYLGYPIPKIVFMPIIFVLFGIGDTGKIVLLTMIIFFNS